MGKGRDGRKGVIVKILMIEDNVSFAFLAGKYLSLSSSFKAEFVTHQSLGEGLKYLEGNNVDVILLDLHLPDSKGLDTVNRVISEYPHIPVIVLTSFDDEDTASEAIKKGAQEYLIKTELASEALSKTISYAIERQSLMNQVKHANALVKENEARFHKMMDENSDAVIVVGPDKIIRYVNPAAEKIFRKSSTEMTGTESSYPLTGRSNVKLVDSDGVRFIEITCGPISWESDPAFICAVRDISESIKIREHEEALKNIIAMSPVITFLWRAEAGWPVELVSANISLFGYSQEDFYSGRIKFADILHPDDLQRVGDEVNFYVENSIDHYEQEYRLRNADGVYKWVSDKSIIKRDAKGGITHFQGVVIDVNGRKLAEEALVSAEKEKATILGSISEVVIFTDEDKNIKWANKAASDAFGMTSDELKHICCYDLWKGNPDDCVLCKPERKSPSASARSLEMNSSDGRIWKINHYPVFQRDKLDGYVIVAQDISSEKEAESILKDRLNFLQTLLDTIPNPVFCKDENCVYNLCNKAYEEFIGFPKSKIIGSTVYDIVKDFGCADSYHKADIDLLAKRGTRVYESTLAHSDGTVRNVIFYKAVYTKTDGQLWGTIGIMIDITERKKREDELKMIYTAVEEAMEAIIITDSEGKAQYMNRAFTEILGYDLDYMKENKITSIYDGDVDYSSYNIDRESSSSRGCQGRAKLRRRDGVIVPALVRSTPIPSVQNGFGGMLFIMTDLTEHEAEEERQRKLEFQLVQAQKLESIGQLAAGIAHEINTPTQFVGDNTNFLKDSFASVVRIIDSYSVLLDKSKAAGHDSDAIGEIEKLLESEDWNYLKDEIPQAIDQTLDGVKRVSDIVLAMKEFSHPKTDEKKNLDINRSVQNATIVTRNEWKYFADLNLELCGESCCVKCYPGELNQVLLNLVVNAAHTVDEANKKLKRAKGSISIKTLKHDDCVEIIIADTGMGIPEEIRPKVYDMFFTTKGVGRGTGQGLAIAYDVIVHKHKGELYFETELDKGTAFHIKLPTGDV
ncbi:MAG: hypothetical protein A2020_13045 [Lentisphaerae bacterium GWF2_45_14]|nr:MAG: hypothetical protein A2020_13045 [Lentisphaerae bacterium GWF2_45_14]